MYEQQIRELQPNKVIVEGHYVDRYSWRGIEKIWQQDQIIVKCGCGTKIRARRNSASCWCGADHAAPLRETVKGLAKNYIVLQRQNNSEKPTREVYKASEIVHTLTRQSSQAQSVSAADAEADAPNHTMSRSATSDNDISLPFYLEDAIIIGNLDLKHHTIKRPLTVKNCWFDGTIDLRYCKFEQAIHFSDCTFYQKFNSGDSTECYTVYQKDLNCDGSHFMSATSFDGIRVESNACFRDSRFEGTVSFVNSRCGGNMHVDAAIFEQEADFTGASFDRNLECSEAEFYELAKFNSMKCGENAHIDNAIFGPEADFTAASVGRNIECSKAHFWGSAKFNSLKCGGNAQMDNAIFEQEADFTAASVGRNIQCPRARFNGPTYLNSLICGGAMIAKRVRFGSEVDARFSSFGLALICDDSTFRGKVDCSGLKCAHDVSFTKARFESDRSRHKGDRGVVVDFTGLTCDGTGRFKHAKFVNDEVVDYRYSRFGRDLDLRCAYFVGKVRLCQTHVKNRLRLGASRFDGEAELYDSDIKILEVIDANFSPESYPIRARSEARVDEFETIIRDEQDLKDKLKPIRFKKVASTLQSRRFMRRKCTIDRLFPFRPGKLNLTDISFERFHGGPHRELARELASRLVEGQDPTKFSRDPYLQLEQYYNLIGEEDDALEMHYAGHCALRDNAKAYRRDPEKGRVHWSREKLWFPDFIWKWTTGYGQRMHRLLLIFLFFAVLGTVVFSSENALTLPPGTKGSPETQEIGQRVVDRAIYSVDLLLPLLDLRTGDIRIPDYAWEDTRNWEELMKYWEEVMKSYEVVHIFIGWLLIGLLLAWITAVARGGR
jgi:hypothetical protein